ncbi:hypothetical protein [Uliginosibacterium gangwonense]|uniref:portal protein n=1 Tax=Uliginosibacterium gangwonense TaxID=392736 RepID=UPI00037033D3|nr:hypothetical protein [Uliginosibacterium gangwonense]
MPVDADLAQKQWLRFSWCRDRGHLDFVAKADKCDKFFAGDQWQQEDLNALKLQRRPAITINKILATISTILGEQIYNRTECLFRPANGSPAETADALSKVWMQISQNNQLPWVRSDVFCDGVIRSRGFYDVRMDFDDAMQGEVRISQLNSKNVVVDPDAEEYDPDTWADVFVTKWVTYQDIAVLYDEEDAEYLRNKEGSSYPYGYDSIERVRDRFAGQIPLGGYYGVSDEAGVRRNIRLLERQYRQLDKQLHFVDVETGDMRPVPVDWDRNRIAALLEKAGGKLSTIKKLVKRIRWTVTADNVVLRDEWSPYKHFTVVPYFPHFRYGRTVGIVENMLGPQEILNKTSSQELHIINTTANSGWVVEENSLTNMTTGELEVSGAQTGLVVEFRKNSTPPQKIQPNQTPTGLDRVSYKAEEHLKGISGVSDSMQGFDREDVAAKAIAYKQQRGSVNLTKVMDNLERTDWILARNVLDLIQQYYTEERLITITHADATREPESIAVNKVNPETGEIVNDLTLGEYSIVITSTPARASMEDSQFEQALALRKEGVPVPDSVLVENSRLQRRADIIKQMEAQTNSPEAQAQAQLQQRIQTAEAAKLEADVVHTKAQAELKQAQAQRELQGNAPDTSLEIQRMQAELALEERRLAAEIQAKQEELGLKRQEMEAKLALERERHQHEVAQQAAAQHAEILRKNAQPATTNEKE